MNELQLRTYSSYLENLRPLEELESEDPKNFHILKNRSSKHEQWRI